MAATVRAVASVRAVMDKAADLAVSSVAVSSVAASTTAEMAYKFNNSNIDNGKQLNWEQK